MLGFGSWGCEGLRASVLGFTGIEALRLIRLDFWVQVSGLEGSGLRVLRV